MCFIYATTIDDNMHSSCVYSERQDCEKRKIIQ
jgi:hypothetical protein